MESLLKAITDLNVPYLVPKVAETRFKNLVVGGCSFTSTNFGDIDFFWKTLNECYNNIKDKSWPDVSARTWNDLPEHIHDECSDHFDWKHLTYLTWPIYIRDMLGISEIYDFSCSGAGNYHISSSVMHGLETKKNIRPEDTLVVIMWSGFDRDDLLVGKDSIISDKASYHYDDSTSLCYTGGLLGKSNSLFPIDTVKKIKSYHSRCIENYLYIVSLMHYLENRGFEYYFTSFSLSTKAQGFEIKKYSRFDLNDLFTVTPFLGDFAKETIDGFHPTSSWHHRWAEEILMPQILSRQ